MRRKRDQLYKLRTELNLNLTALIHRAYGVEVLFGL